jgi:hypothetical protein
VLKVEKLFDLFPPDKAEVTEKGLLFNGNYYSCSIAIKEQWYLQDGGISRKIPIYVDSYDNEYILVLLNDGSLTIAYRVYEEMVMSEQSIKNYQETIRSLKQQLKKRKRVKR